MPRPGPRPYECVRRAWHSERHQPMRGSLIQEIFRVVNEIHSTATKKNKEWQEKLPVVVLKSEEIMYSKANSEAEYMDLKTLLDRTNDAINTIIRRDESTETGELLPPCIEAALNLGCTPRRTSRSQRNSNQRCYLNSSTQEPINVENVAQGNHPVQSQGMAHYSPLMKQTMNATQNLVVRNISCSASKLPFAPLSAPPSSSFPMENYPASCSVYPLYYGTCFKVEETPHGFENFHNLTSSNMEPANVNVDCNSSFSGNSSSKILQTYIKDIPHSKHDIGCDLSLRLGPLSVPCPSVEHNQQEQVKEVGYSYLEGNRFSDFTPQMNKQILFFSNANVSDLLDMRSSQQSGDGNVDTNKRKRKAVSTYPLEDQHFGWQPKLQCSQLAGRMKSAGS